VPPDAGTHRYPGKSFTGGTNTENIWVSGKDPNIPDFGAAAAFLDAPATRCALHIGNLSMGQVDQYHAMVLSGDFMLVLTLALAPFFFPGILFCSGVALYRL
jgi:hypothetical protein